MKMHSNRIVAFIPAAGKGERLLPLTKNMAKPSLPIGMNNNGDIVRMIELSIDLIDSLNAEAYVSLDYCSNSLKFINKRRHINPFFPKNPWIDDSILELIEFLKSNSRKQFDYFLYIPADYNLDVSIVEEMIDILDVNEYYAVLLCANSVKNHNVRFRSKESCLCRNGTPCGDLGVYLVRWDMFVKEAENNRRVDILRGWEKCMDNRRIFLHIPENGPQSVDLGTPYEYYEYVRNRCGDTMKDSKGNISFPGSRINPFSEDCIALPYSDSSSLVLKKCVIPENTSVLHMSEVLKACD